MTFNSLDDHRVHGVCLETSPSLTARLERALVPPRRVGGQVRFLNGDDCGILLVSLWYHSELTLQFHLC
jgi:hypothetical protein